MSFLSSIPVWGWFDILFTLMVLAGVCGESSWLERILIPDKPNDLLPVESKRKQLKKRFEFVLIIGIAGELICLPFSLWESAKLNKDAADSRLVTAKLEQQIAQTSTNVVKIDPLKQPIKSISAQVFLQIRGTNFFEMYETNSELAKRWSSLTIFGKSGSVAELQCKDIEIATEVAPPEYKGNPRLGKLFLMDFRWHDDLMESWEAAITPTNFPFRDWIERNNASMEELDKEMTAVSILPPGVSAGNKIVSSFCVVTFNPGSFQRRFLIPSNTDNPLLPCRLINPSR